MSPSLANNGPKRCAQPSRRQSNRTASRELSDLELIILSRAAQHPDCLARTADHPEGGDAERAIGSLEARGLLSRMPESHGPSERGIIGEQDCASWRITSAGLSAIGVDPSELPDHCQHLEGQHGGAPIRSLPDGSPHLETAVGTKDGKHSRKARLRADAELPSSALVTCKTVVSGAMPALDARKDTNSARLVGLLCREDGASIAENMEATGWLAHSSRAALTGLRKKGHTVQREQDVVNRGTVYRIVAEVETIADAEV